MTAILKSSQNSYDNKALYHFTEGTKIDSRLAHQEIRVQKAWVHELTKIGIFTEVESTNVILALNEALTLMETGKFDWRIQELREGGSTNGGP